MEKCSIATPSPRWGRTWFSLRAGEIQLNVTGRKGYFLLKFKRLKVSTKNVPDTIFQSLVSFSSPRRGKSGPPLPAPGRSGAPGAAGKDACEQVITGQALQRSGGGAGGGGGRGRGGGRRSALLLRYLVGGCVPAWRVPRRADPEVFPPSFVRDEGGQTLGEVPALPVLLYLEDTVTF